MGESRRIRRPLPLAAGLAVVLAGVLGVAVSAGAHADERIVGGSRASTAQHPYVVYLADPTGFQFCGGTLVTRTKVVTAAHCVVRQNVRDLRVVAGRDDKYSRDGVVDRVSRVWVHPGFTGVQSGSDVAVLTLVNRLSFGTATLPAANSPLYRPGTSSTILGWGRVNEDGPTSRYLLAASVPVVPDDSCAQAYTHFSAGSMVCAGYPQGGVDACQGDSGGPMMVGRVLVGIASWGDGCARPGLYGVYTRVASYTDLIAAQL